MKASYKMQDRKLRMHKTHTKKKQGKGTLLFLVNAVETWRGRVCEQTESRNWGRRKVVRKSEKMSKETLVT